MVDVEALEWFIKEGGTVKIETILELIKEVKGDRIWYNDMKKNGCGYRECGLAESGFSNWDD